ncbi:MAG: HAMP domain-containing protein [Cellvibrionaceae bacterium]|nr:HAMP domain-containing protein [Cellvibrionaceae bacterium]
MYSNDLSNNDMSLRLKTIIGIGVIEGILLIILISTVLGYMRQTNEQSLEQYVNTTTTLFATTAKDAVLSFDLASLETFIEEILKNEGVLYTRIYDNNENILAEGGNKILLARSFVEDTQYRDVTDTVYDAKALITVDEAHYGRIEMGISTRTIEDAINETRYLAAIIALAEMALVALFSFFLGTYLTSQLKVLRKASRKISQGDFSHKIDIKSRDEVGEVAHSFNKMVVSLKKAEQDSKNYQQELLTLNQSLEDRIKRRTEKIIEQKDSLQNAFDKLKLTQNQLVQSEKMASIGQLAAGVAHEINNPIAFVKSNLNSLQKYIESYRHLISQQECLTQLVDKAQPQEIKELAKDIKTYCEEEDMEFINEDVETLIRESIDGTQRVQEIVSGLKTYARASDEGMEPHSINDCIATSLKMLANELKYKCEIITDFGELPDYTGNRSKLTQVYTNLIVNANHAITTQGTITVSTACENNHILIKIADTGEGIAPENLPKLFDPFFTTKDVGEGTGLGLAISLGIINDHKGTIDVDSTLGKGKGTSFTIKLPIA